MTKKIHVIQHSAGDSPGEVETIAGQLGHSLQITRIDQNDPIPVAAQADALMLFGGPISLTDGDLPDWVQQECELIRRYADQGRHVLGVCLGSQLVASALGAQVKRNTMAEVGWHVVDRISDVDSKIADVFPTRFTAFHWHRDTWELPDGAKLILKSDGCEHQGFVIDDRICGFQCHLEANQRTVEIFCAVSDMHRQRERFVQTERAIREGIGLHLAKQNDILRNLLRAWLS